MRIPICFLLGVILGISGCSWQKKEDKLDENSPVKVQVPVYTEGTYRMEIVELRSLNNISELKGSAAKFLLDPGTSKGKLHGRDPHIRYMRDSNDVIVALDDLSLQLLTVYAHFEKLKNLDESAGAKNVLNYPRTVAVNAKFRSSEGLLENNALYSGQYDALLVVPYTQNALPIMANAGVIGHEHFHALFQKLVVEPLKDKYPDPDHPTLHAVEEMGLTTTMARKRLIKREKVDQRELYHTILLRGVNEGFADLWGWIFSGDTGFVGRSLPSQKVIRELEVVPSELYTKDDILNPVKNGEDDEELLLRSYQYGTQLARGLKNFSKIYGHGKKMTGAEVQAAMSKFLTATLPELRKKFEALKDDEYLTLSQVALLFVDQVKDMGSDECNFIAKLMPGEEAELFKMEPRCKAIEEKEASPKP
jgi:hypothetical protein